MGVARNVLLLGAKKYHVDVLNIVLLMVVVYGVSWQAAIGLQLGKYNYVELTGVELVRNRTRFRVEKFVYLDQYKERFAYL